MISKLWLQYKTCESSELAGAFLHYSLLGMLPKVFAIAENDFDN